MDIIKSFYAEFFIFSIGLLLFALMFVYLVFSGIYWNWEFPHRLFMMIVFIEVRFRRWLKRMKEKHIVILIREEENEEN